MRKLLSFFIIILVTISSCKKVKLEKVSLEEIAYSISNDSFFSNDNYASLSISRTGVKKIYVSVNGEDASCKYIPILNSFTFNRKIDNLMEAKMVSYIRTLKRYNLIGIKHYQGYSIYRTNIKVDDSLKYNIIKINNDSINVFRLKFWDKKGKIRELNTFRSLNMFYYFSEAYNNYDEIYGNDYE